MRWPFRAAKPPPATSSYAASPRPSASHSRAQGRDCIGAGLVRGHVKLPKFGQGARMRNIIVALTLLPSIALAQSSSDTFYDASGRIAGTAETQGNVTTFATPAAA